MHFELISSKLAKIKQEKTDALLIILPNSEDTYAELPSDIAEHIAFACTNGDLDSKNAPVCTMYRPSETQARYIALLSIETKGNALTFASLQKSVATAIQTLSKHKIQSLSIAIEPLLSVLSSPNASADKKSQDVGHAASPRVDVHAGLSAVLQAVDQALYTYEHTKPSAKASAIQTLRVLCDKPKEIQADFDKALAVVHGIATAREWGNRPANHATPTHLGQAALALAKTHPALSCKVLGRKDIEKLKMNAFLAVTQGSAEEPQFIVLEYKGGAKTQAALVLVGKGVTFDTGGISIKPAAQLDEMKFDMCGAASVLGTFDALARLRLKINVVGLIPACENMPSSHAVKPGDVVTSMSGQTIEILNTDAEGRLILCDALTYAARYKPQAIVDIATLTGACVIALGGVRAGLFSNDEALAQNLSQAGEQSGDLCWRMPLDAEYAEGLQSNFADMGNIGGREAGSVTAAKFLEKFITDTPWAHLDIAGVAWKSGKNKSATGRPVALLTQYLLTQSAEK